MRSSSCAVGALCACLTLSGVATPVATPGFARIASELDVGGDYLEVINAATFQKDIDAVLDALVWLGKDLGGLTTEDCQQIHSVREVVSASGLLSFRGCGSSVQPLADGSYRHRSFILTEKGRNPLLDLFASGPRSANVENYLPRTTAAALSFSTDVKGSILFAAEAAGRFSPTQAAFLRALGDGTSEQGALVDGIAPGTMVAVTLDMERPWRVPGQRISLPTPGVLIAQAVRTDQPWMMAKAGLAAVAGSANVTCSQMPSPDFPGVERLIFTLPDAEAKDWNITPACAYDRRGGVILFASSTEVLAAALAAGSKKKARLLDDPVFCASAGEPAPISGLVYLSPQVVPVVADVVRQILRAESITVPPSAQRLLDNPPQFWATGKFTRLPDGVKSECRMSCGAGNTLRMLLGNGSTVALGGVGVAMGALFPAISSATRKANASTMAMKGRKLFVAITETNTEREGQQTASVWPKSAKDKDEDAKDIAGMDFRTSTEFFNELLDVKNYGTKDWKPYVEGLDLSVLKIKGAQELSKFTGKSLRAEDVDWCVLKGMRDEMEDVVPVLVSANVNVRDLPVSGDFDGRSRKAVGIGRAAGAAKDLFDNKAFVIVRKGGSAEVVDAKYNKLYQVYKNTPFSVPSDAQLKYLEP